MKEAVVVHGMTILLVRSLLVSRRQDGDLRTAMTRVLQLIERTTCIRGAKSHELEC